MAARLVIGDPARPALIAEHAVHYIRMQNIAGDTPDPVLAARIRMRPEQPASALVVERLRERAHDAHGRFGAFGRPDAAPFEFAGNARSQGFDARGRPA